MIRAECTKLIKFLFKNGKINEKKKNKCLEYISKEKVHEEIRNLVMMILLPKRLHFDGAHQAAFLRAAVSRVSKLILTLSLTFYFRLQIKLCWSKRDCSFLNLFIGCVLLVMVISICPDQVFAFFTKLITIRTRESSSDQTIYRLMMQSIKILLQVKSKL